MEDEVVVYIKNLGKKIKANYNDTLGNVLARNNLLPLPCGGRGLCGQCIVKIKGRVSEPTGNELSRGLGGELRLACQTRLLGNVEVELYYKPMLNVSHFSYNIVLRKTKPIYQVFDIIPEKLPLITSEEVIIAKDNCLSRGNKIISLLDHPISATNSYKREEQQILLVDLGTTKIAYQIVDGKGNISVEKIMLNPLIRYGSDIITRLSEITVQPGKIVEMRNLLIETIEKVIRNYENIVMVAFAGNSVNQSILLGLPIDKLAVKPYQPYFRGPFIGVMSTCTPFYAAPFIGGFVGSDAFSNIAAVEYIRLEKPYLIIDIGTNTEVIIGTGRDKDPVYATSTPAGPAFEGHIESGVGIGFPGISKVRIKEIHEDRLLFDYTIEGGNKPAGFLGSGTISLMAELLRNGIIDKRGRIIKGYTRIKGVKTLTIVDSNGTATGKPIVFTQLDVRELQKAVSAVKTSWQLLLREAGIGIEELDWVVLTGTFGSAIEVDDAFILGLIPRVPENKVIIAGNMVLSGLKTLVLDLEHERNMRSLLRKTKSIDLAEIADFTSMWIKNLEFSEY